MDINVSNEELKKFLKKCHCEGLVKDIILQADDGTLSARFTDKTGSIYCEVYMDSVKVNVAGTIRVPSLKKLIDVISRSDSKMLRILAKDDVFFISDGIAVGRMKIDMLQVSDAGIVESFQLIKDMGKMFDKSELEYTAPGFKYEQGCRISHGMLGVILKDAKAFGYETYTMEPAKVKEKMTLKCFIINQHSTEKFQRIVADSDFIGKAKDIPRSSVGRGFREMIQAILGEEKDLVDIYFHEKSWLITDGKTFFYNLHTLNEN